MCVDYLVIVYKYNKYYSFIIMVFIDKIYVRFLRIYVNEVVYSQESEAKLKIILRFKVEEEEEE